MSLELTTNPAAHCTLIREFEYELTWRPEKDCVAGSQVELRADCLRSFLSWRYVELTMLDGDVTFRWKVNPLADEIFKNKDRVILRARLQYGARRGCPYRFRLRAIPPVWAGIDLGLSVWTIGPDRAREIDAELPPAELEQMSSCTLPVVSGPVERLCLYSRPASDKDGRVRIVISPQDRFGNPARFEQPRAVNLEFDGKGQCVTVEGTTAVSLSMNSESTLPMARVNMQDLDPTENIGNAVVEGANFVVTGNPIDSTFPRGLRPAFGEFHWHTEISGDGQRPIREALRCARDELNLDFAAPGDHNTREKDWEDTVAALDEFEAPGAFATFFGWEASSPQGHENFYFTDPGHPMVCGGGAGITGGKPHENLDTLKKHRDFLAIPHHTNAIAETRRATDDAPYWHPYSWTEPTDAHRLVEVFQIRGNQERNDYTDVWRGWHQNHGASVQDALAKGYRLGFTGGTDNHCGWPGRAFARCESLGLHPPCSQILTGVWTTAVERQAVYDALAARHTWAVWDTRAIVWFTVNNALMGDEIEIKPGAELTARIRIHAEAPFQTVELVSEGNVLWQQSFAEPDIDEEVTLPPPEQSTHVYLRALLRNGGILYGSPVFVAVV